MAQCESRAHRIGQKSPVTCRYLLAKGTADDYMWNMLTKKQDVLSKAGIFSEDLTDATHSSVTIEVRHDSSMKMYMLASTFLSKLLDSFSSHRTHKVNQMNKLQTI